MSVDSECMCMIVDVPLAKWMLVMTQILSRWYCIECWKVQGCVVLVLQPAL
jgi:hypothetical protein